MNLESSENLKEVWQLLGSFRKYFESVCECVFYSCSIPPTWGRGWELTTQDLWCWPTLKSCLAFLVKPKAGGLRGWLQWSHSQGSSQTSDWEQYFHTMSSAFQVNILNWNPGYLGMWFLVLLDVILPPLYRQLIPVATETWHQFSSLCLSLISSFLPGNRTEVVLVGILVLIHLSSLNSSAHITYKNPNLERCLCSRRALSVGSDLNTYYSNLLQMGPQNLERTVTQKMDSPVKKPDGWVPLRTTWWAMKYYRYLQPEGSRFGPADGSPGTILHVHHNAQWLPSAGCLWLPLSSKLSIIFVLKSGFAPYHAHSPFPPPVL